MALLRHPVLMTSRRCVFIFDHLFVLAAPDPALDPTYSGLDRGLVCGTRIFVFWSLFALDFALDPAQYFIVGKIAG